MRIADARTAAHVIDDLGLFGRRQPFRILWCVVEVKVGNHAQETGWQTLDDEHPLPAEQAVQAIETSHQPAGERPAAQPGDTRRTGEQRDDPRTTFDRIPAREVKDHAGVQGGLGYSEQEPDTIKMGWLSDEGCTRGEQPPKHHDPQKGRSDTDTSK